MESTKDLLDLLVREFWKLGYSIINRRLGKFHSPPPSVGGFEIDILAKKNKEYGIGVLITSVHLKNNNLASQISFLSSRISKSTKNKVLLIIGTTIESHAFVKEMVFSLRLNTKNIKVVLLSDVQYDIFSSPTYSVNSNLPVV